MLGALSAVHVVSSIGLTITTGYVFERQFIRNKAFWDCTDTLTYNLLAPLLFAFVANKANFLALNVSNAVIATIISTAIIIAIIFLVQLFLKAKDDIFIPVFQGGIRANSYIFLAISNLIYGETGGAIACVFVVCTLVITNITFTVIVNRQRDWRKKCVSIAKALIQNPLIMGSCVGLFFSALGLHFTELETVKNYLYCLGNAATPLSLLSIGASLNLTIHWKTLVVTVYTSSLKLFFMPVCTMIMLQLFGVTGVVASIALLYSALPCAGNASAASRKLGGNLEITSSITTCTTLISMLTMSLLLAHLS